MIRRRWPETCPSCRVSLVISQVVPRFTMKTASCSLDLLDSESGHVLQTWDLDGNDTIHLGRAREADLVFSSPYVSRSHAYLRRDEQGWELTCISKVGVFIDGRRIESIVLTDGMIFRLAERGPLIKFRSVSRLEAATGNETISFESAQTPLLVLDTDQLNNEVRQITEGDYFKELQRRMAELRAARVAGS